MNGRDIMNSLTDINDSYITEFADTSRFQKKKPFYLSVKFYTGMAAALAVSVGILTAVSLRGNISSSDTVIRNNTPVPSQSAAPSQTAPSDQPKEDDFFNIANEPANTVTKDSEGTTIAPVTDNAAVSPFSVRVCTSENSVPVSLTAEPVEIKGDFNPLLSSSRGLGIEMELTCPESGLILRTDNGHFLSWDTESGAVTNYGSEYTASGIVRIFWTLSDNSPEWDSVTSITVLDGSRKLLSVIEITGNEDTHTFTASLKNA